MPQYIDPTVLMQGKGIEPINPLVLAEHGATLADLFQGNQMGQMKLDAAKQAMAAQGAFNTALPQVMQGGFSPDSVMAAIKANPAAAPALLKMLEDRRKAEAEYGKTTSETAKNTATANETRLKPFTAMAYQLANKPDLSPQDISGFSKLIADNGLQGMIPSIPMQDWNSPEAARKNLKTIGAAFFDADKQASQAEGTRQFGITSAETATQGAATRENMLAQQAMARGNLGVSQGQLAATLRGQDLTDARSREANVNAAGGKQIGNVSAIRKELNSLPDIQSYRAALPMLNSATTAPDTRSGDLDVIYAVGKALDPGSVVREGELNLVIKSGSLPQQLVGMTSSVMGGGKLTPSQRADLIAMLNNRVGQLKIASDTAAQPFKTQAEQAGLPWDQISTTPSTLEAQGRTLAAANPKAALNRSEQDNYLREAKIAISRGKSREAVKARLIELGVPDANL
jgi:hypothetical protein